MQKTLLIASLVCLGLGLGTANKAHAAATQTAFADATATVVDALSDLERIQPGTLAKMDASGDASVIASKLSREGINSVLKAAADARVASASNQGKIVNALFEGNTVKAGLLASTSSVKAQPKSFFKAVAAAPVVNMNAAKAAVLADAQYAQLDKNLRAAGQAALADKLVIAQSNALDMGVSIVGPQFAKLLAMAIEQQITFAKVIADVYSNANVEKVNYQVTDAAIVAALMSARGMTAAQHDAAVTDAQTLGLIAGGVCADKATCEQCRLAGLAK